MENRGLVALRLYYFAGFAALGIYLPAFPRWLEARGITGLSLGVIAAALPSMGLLSPVLFGALADRFRLRGWLLRAASLGALAAMTVLAVAALLGAPSYPLLCGCIFAFAFFRAPMVTIADVVALEHTVAGSYGRLRSWGSLGFMLAAMAAGPWLGAAQALPIAVALALAASLAVALAVPGRATQPLERPGRGSSSGGLSSLVRQRATVVFLASAFTWALGHSAYDLCYSLHLRDLGYTTGTVGVLWAGGVLAEIALLARAAPLVQRFGAARLLPLAMLGASLRWLLLSQARSLPALAAIQLLHALSFALAWVCALRQVQRESEPELLGTFQGTFAAAVALGGVAGMLAWSSAYRAWGGSIVFQLAAVVALAAGALTTGYAWLVPEQQPAAAR